MYCQTAASELHASEGWHLLTVLKDSPMKTTFHPHIASSCLLGPLWHCLSTPTSQTSPQNKAVDGRELHKIAQQATLDS
jgi:hypothetical protein